MKTITAYTHKLPPSRFLSMDEAVALAKYLQSRKVGTTGICHAGSGYAVGLAQGGMIDSILIALYYLERD